jgi:hypothetical protein
MHRKSVIAYLLDCSRIFRRHWQRSAAALYQALFDKYGQLFNGTISEFPIPISNSRPIAVIPDP